MQMQVHFGSFFPCKTIMEALRAFALVNMGREVFTAKTFSPRECDVFFFWLRINRSSGINRRIERCERPQAPESLIGGKEMPLFCEVSLRFRVHLFCHSTTRGYMAKCNWYSLYATWEKQVFFCVCGGWFLQPDESSWALCRHLTLLIRLQCFFDTLGKSDTESQLREERKHLSHRGIHCHSLVFFQRNVLSSAGL